MHWLIIGCFLAALVYGAMVWYANTRVATVKKALVSLGVTGLIIVAILLVVNISRGNIGFLPLLIFLVPLARKIRLQSNPRASSRKYKKHTGAKSGMSRAEALDILGLREGATQDEIKAAYRKMIASAHPDVGGSDWMASKINEAKRVLMKD